jgi:hypothetical protein
LKFLAADVYQNPCKQFAADADLIQTRRFFKVGTLKICDHFVIFHGATAP